jgi:hypothetical protein
MYTLRKETYRMFVPVVDCNQQPLMPTTPARARRWIKSGKATPFWKKGVFCVRLNVEPSDRQTQPVAVGVDPGSKKEGWTVKSTAHTYLNIQADAVTWVKEHVEQRRQMRRARRYRKTPCRQPRFNRARGGIPPSSEHTPIADHTGTAWASRFKVLRTADANGEPTQEPSTFGEAVP